MNSEEVWNDIICGEQEDVERKDCKSAVLAVKERKRAIGAAAER